MGVFEQFPYTNFHDLNLNWILDLIRKLAGDNETINSWIAVHETQYEDLANKVEGLINNLVDVIAPWDSSVAYHIFSIVEYQGANYIAIQDVPVGVMITNTDYWQQSNTVVEQINAMGVIVSGVNAWKNLQPVTPQDFGAVADGVTDDSDAINAAFATQKPVYFPTGQYYIGTHSIVINGLFNTSVDMSSAWIHYDGTEYAIDITYMDCVDFRIGYIDAPNGGGLKLHSSAPGNHIQYDNIYFHRITCATNCIFINPSGTGWVNEIRIHDGKFDGGNYGLFVQNDGTYTANNYAVTNVGVEGVTTGFRFDSIGNLIGEILVVGCRMHESFSYLYEIHGAVHTVHHISAHELDPSWLVLGDGNAVRWRFDCPVIDSITGLRHESAYTDVNSVLRYGDNVYQALTSKEQLPTSTDLNTLTKEGLYWSPLAVTSTLVNAPADLSASTAYTLINETKYNHSYYKQTIESYNNTDRWVRYSNADASSWTPWVFLPEMNTYETINATISLNANGHGSYTFANNRTAYAVELLYTYACYQYKLHCYLEPNARGVTIIGHNTTAVSVDITLKVWFTSK